MVDIILRLVWVIVEYQSVSFLPHSAAWVFEVDRMMNLCLNQLYNSLDRVGYPDDRVCTQQCDYIISHDD